MEERINAYNISHKPQKTWDTFSAQIKHAENDLLLMTANCAKVGKIPRDIRQTLRSLRDAIDRALIE